MIVLNLFIIMFNSVPRYSVCRYSFVIHLSRLDVTLVLTFTIVLNSYLKNGNVINVNLMIIP